MVWNGGADGGANAGRPQPSLQWMAHGLYRFKGAEDAMEVFEVGGVGVAPMRPPPDAEKFFCANETVEYFFFPSRLSASKRQSLVLEALALTKEKVRVRFAGLPDSSDYGKHLKLLARKLGVESRVDWLGFISEEEKRENYAKAIAVVFPPVDEDYGYVTLEAMLSSKPVITCSDSGGPLEFVVHEKTGLVAKPTASALAEAFDALWRERKAAAKYGQTGRDSYERLHLSWSEVVRQLLK